MCNVLTAAASFLLKLKGRALLLRTPTPPLQPEISTNPGALADDAVLCEPVSA